MCPKNVFEKKIYLFNVRNHKCLVLSGYCTQKYVTIILGELQIAQFSHHVFHDNKLLLEKKV